MTPATPSQLLQYIADSITELLDERISRFRPEEPIETAYCKIRLIDLRSRVFEAMARDGRKLADIEEPVVASEPAIVHALLRKLR